MASKSSGRPNLALAGKREAQAPKSSSSSGGAKRGRGRGRGGRFDNARGAHHKKPELIQTGGVFSEGLGGDFPTRTREKDADVQQFSWKKKEDKDKNQENGEKRKKDKSLIAKDGQSDGKTSFKGWEELWESDEEEDKKQLKNIFPKGFISDLKKGTIMPFVLPADDKPQFKNVLRNYTHDEDEHETIEDKKPQISNTAEKNQVSPEELIAMIEASTSDLLHLQLPSIIGTICHNSVQQELPMEIDGEETEPNNLQSSSNDILPKSTHIGKLQITRKGKILLQIEGYTVDITSKKTVGKQQGVILLQTDPAGQQVVSASNSQPQFISPNNVDNEICYIGNVKHNLVGSVTWEKLNEEKQEKKIKIEKNCENGMEKIEKNQVLNATEVRIVKELEDVQKGWEDQANSWSHGSLI